MAGVEFVWKAWIYFEKLTKNPKKAGFSFQSGPNLMSFAFNWRVGSKKLKKAGFSFQSGPNLMSFAFN